MQLPESGVGPDEAQQVARQVLNGEKYLEAARPPSLRERFIDWVSEAISDLLSALSSGGGRGIIAWVIIGVFLIAIVFLVSRLLRRFEPLNQVQPSRDAEIELFSDRSAEEWLSAAVEAEAAGDFRSGLRCRHRALVVRLIDRQVVEVRPGLTAGEISRRVATRVPAAADDMHQATWTFQAAWFGHRVADTGSRDTFEAHATRVLAIAELHLADTQAVPA